MSISSLCSNGQSGLVNIWMEGKGLTSHEKPFKKCKHNLDGIDFKVGPAGYPPGELSFLVIYNQQCLTAYVFQMSLFLRDTSLASLQAMSTTSNTSLT